MKHYHYNIVNADKQIINKITVIANNIESARKKVNFKVNTTYRALSSFLRIDFNFHDCSNPLCCEPVLKSELS
jgi:hypothetical protein